MKFDPIERQQGHRKVSTFLDKIGFDSISKSEKISKLKSMTFEEFVQLTERLNRQLRTIDKKTQLAEDDGEPVFIKNRSQFEIDYISPRDARGLLRDFFEKMKTDLNEDNLEKYSVKLFYAIIFAHIFADGNGRTARYLKRLLSESKPKLKDAESNLESRKESGPELANKLALFEIFNEERIQIPEPMFMEIETPDDVRRYAPNTLSRGLGHALRTLAIIKSRPEITFTEVYEILKDDPYDWLPKDSTEKALIDAQYEKLAKRLFWKVQEILDKEPDVNKAEESFRTKIEELNRKRREKLYGRK